MNNRPNLRHKDDKSLWVSSHPQTSDEERLYGTWAKSLFDRDANCYFFREVEPGPWYWPFYRRTGKIWEGSRNSDFPFEIIK